MYCKSGVSKIQRLLGGLTVNHMSVTISNMPLIGFYRCLQSSLKLFQTGPNEALLESNLMSGLHQGMHYNSQLSQSSEYLPEMNLNTLNACEAGT